MKRIVLCALLAPLLLLSAAGAFESSQYKGGTMRPMIESFCLTRVTKARTVELREQLELRRR